MDFQFLVMEKSWKINVEKEGAPWTVISAYSLQWQWHIHFDLLLDGNLKTDMPVYLPNQRM